ncbi:flagellar basal-body MS-ring/collar protein FliF [Novosphingobium sp.]|uniref:flagellar basal-body MS-ring/collar protein FliF n=1 Tax=Novosphingobium sp. TaxID=1874826 RepID=UPI00286DD8CD|nr:flagellar basal-body MS-ring/collar protein FliF [Novosphingobium sp.]
MADLAPAVISPAPAPSLLSPLTDPAGGPALTRLKSFTSQGPVRRMLPWFGGVAGIGLVALAWATLSPAPQRVLYTELNDGERAKVVSALDKAQIAYAIDNQTGTLTVGEDDLYKARMLVAEDGALAAPAGGVEALPMGASRTMEGEHLRTAQERELTLSIMEIDGVEAVRVHLAQAEKSVFVRDNIAPSASVMVRLARGRSLGDSQVAAIVNLVAGSVPGMSADSVRLVDQHGRLLTAKVAGGNERIEMQGQLEEKLRAQLDALLTPMLGAGNFSNEVQVELDMDQVTSARESYDKQGVLRSETQAASQTTATTPATGVPGVLSNTPPPAATATPAPPTGTPAAPAGTTPPANGESSATRNYELGREVAVSNGAPGKIKRLSVAVALSGAVMAKAKPQDIEQIKTLVSAAVGANPQRGDQVAVMVRTFDASQVEALPIYEQGWFLTLVRYGAALIGVILVLLLGVRPLVRALKREPAPAETPLLADATINEQADAATQKMKDPVTGAIDAALLGRQVSMAQTIVAERPDQAVEALRDMLRPADPEGAAA